MGNISPKTSQNYFHKICFSFFQLNRYLYETTQVSAERETWRFPKFNELISLTLTVLVPPNQTCVCNCHTWSSKIAFVEIRETFCREKDLTNKKKNCFLNFSWASPLNLTPSYGINEPVDKLFVSAEWLTSLIPFPSQYSFPVLNLVCVSSYYTKC